MEPKDSKLMEKVLQLTLEIINLLTGERNITVIKTIGDGQIPTLVPLSSLLIPERNNDQKILEVTQQITELLTGEVPIRCQDVSVYFSMEEWEYLEEHKDLCKDIVMMEDQSPLTSPDGSSNRNPPERCSWQTTQEGHAIPYHDPDTVLKNLKVEEEDHMYDQTGDQQHMEDSGMSFTVKKEEYFIGHDTDGSSNRNPLERCPFPQDSSQEALTSAQSDQDGNLSDFFGKITEDDKGAIKDIVMMENQLPLTSSDGFSNRNPPERCPSPLDTQDPTQEDHTIPRHDQLSDSDSDLESLMESSDSDWAPEDHQSSDSECETARASGSMEDGSVAHSWYAIDPSLHKPAPPRFPFIGEPGLKVQCADNPLAYLKLFLNEAVIEKIVKETNCYAEQQLAAPHGRFSRIRKWEPITQNDIWLFLGLIILQGVVRKPLQSWYWSTNLLISTPFFRHVMPEYRFGLIMKFLYFANNDDFDKTTHPAPKLKKIWKVYQMITDNFRSCYVPDKDITLDESLMAYKGKLSSVQCMASKRASFGVKSFLLCESKSGYIWNSVIYMGKGTKFNPQFDSFGVASSAALSLIEPLLNQGYCLATDNVYSSPELYEFLIQNQTDAYGTVRVNRRELPANFGARKLKRGEMIAWQKDKMLALRWRDKKDVCIMSTIHSTATIPFRTKSGKVIQRPKVVVDYNHTMFGVDRADQAMTFYPAVRRQQQKFYKKVFRHLLEQCLWNAFILYKHQNQRHVQHHDFIWQLCEAICAKYLTPQATTQWRFSNAVNPLRLSARHFPKFFPSTPKRKSPTRRCVVCCSKRGEDGKRIRRETRSYCPDCGIGLCAIPCFEIYHTRETY